MRSGLVYGMAAILAAGTAAAIAVGQGGGPAAGGAGAAAEVQHSYAGLKTYILKAAEDMPAGIYSYKPTPDIRTFARVVNHISEAQMHTCGVVNGTSSDALAKVPPETADKQQIVEALKASFAECDKAYGSADAENFAAMLPAGKAKRSRAGLLWGNVSHDNEQYATLALYLRLKGIVPPSSEK